MYERLKDRNVQPTFEEAMAFIGTSIELFEYIDNLLVNKLNARKEIDFSNHDKCWGMSYYANDKLICGIYFEKDAIFVVVKFSLAKDNLQSYECMYNSLSPHAKMCVDSSPWRHVGFVEYRVLTTDQLDDLILMLNCRANQKYKRKPTK